MLEKQKISYFSKFFVGVSTLFILKIALRCAMNNLGVKKSLGPLKKPLEIADNVFCPHKKITSRTIRISGCGTLIVPSFDAKGERVAIPAQQRVLTEMTDNIFVIL
jgi:uncharacterized Fe-S cluster-containing radical SAM superfamily protein